MSNNGTPSKSIHTLRRRLDHLTQTPAVSVASKNYQLSEMVALKVAIARLEELREYTKKYAVIGRINPEHEVVSAAILAFSSGMLEGDEPERVRLRAAVDLMLDKNLE